MELYKKVILKEFEKRKFELTEIQHGESLPWWIEEKWILGQLKSDSYNDQIVVTFLTDKNWERGKKIVEEILVTKTEMENYSDYSSKIIELDMKKGNLLKRNKFSGLNLIKNNNQTLQPL